MNRYMPRVTGVDISDRHRCPPITSANYRLTTSSSGFQSFELVPDLDTCGKVMVKLLVKPRRRAKGVVFVIGIGTGEARGCNAAHIVKGMKSGAEALLKIAADDEGELEWYLIDFAWT